jgi:hypothetical protein
MVLILSVLSVSASAYGTRQRAPQGVSNGLRGSRVKCATTKTFTSDQLSFRYSGCWTSRIYDDRTTFTDLVDVLSNEKTHSPCRVTATSNLTCGWPLRHLQRSGVLIEWTFGGQPGWELGNEKGTSLIVDGQPAREDVRHQGCGTAGGDEKITVYVSRSELSNYLLMTACLQSPKNAIELQRLTAMLDSVNVQT